MSIEPEPTIDVRWTIIRPIPRPNRCVPLVDIYIAAVVDIDISIAPIDVAVIAVAIVRPITITSVHISIAVTVFHIGGPISVVPVRAPVGTSIIHLSRSVGVPIGRTVGCPIGRTICIAVDIPIACARVGIASITRALVSTIDGSGPIGSRWPGLPVHGRTWTRLHAASTATGSSMTKALGL